MRNRHHVPVQPKDQTTQFIQHLTNELNQFFNKISRHGYSFQCVHTQKQTNEEHIIELKKAYRTFKKFLISQKLIDPELGQKARQRFANRVWEQLNESQKYKYFTGKHLLPLHYLQKLVNNVKQKRQASNRNSSSLRTVNNANNQKNQTQSNQRQSFIQKAPMNGQHIISNTIQNHNNGRTQQGQKKVPDIVIIE